jgi:hypothetical protein
MRGGNSSTASPKKERSSTGPRVSKPKPGPPPPKTKGDVDFKIKYPTLGSHHPLQHQPIQRETRWVRVASGTTPGGKRTLPWSQPVRKRRASGGWEWLDGEGRGREDGMNWKNEMIERAESSRNREIANETNSKGSQGLERKKSQHHRSTSNMKRTEGKAGPAHGASSRGGSPKFNKPSSRPYPRYHMPPNKALRPPLIQHFSYTFTRMLFFDLLVLVLLAWVWLLRGWAAWEGLRMVG